MIKKKKKNRFRFLKKLYEVADGSELYIIDMWKLGDELNFEKTTTTNVVEYLKAESLIKAMTLGGGIAITHYGRLEIEQAMENPNKSTEHFMPINVFNIKNMNNSTIQQGTSNSIQNNYFDSENIRELKEMIEKLDKYINKLEDSELKKEIIAENRTLKAQSESPNPKERIIKESLKSIKEIAKSISVKTICSQISKLLESFEI